MRWALLALLLAGCTRHHAETFLKRGHRFHGERWVHVYADGEDANSIERALRHHGFTVSRSLPGEKATLEADYILKIAGACYPEGMGSYAQSTVASYTGGYAPEELSVEVYEAQRLERVFAAHLGDNHDCPDAFFEEVAAALARNWRGEPD